MAFVKPNRWIYYKKTHFSVDFIGWNNKKNYFCEKINEMVKEKEEVELFLRQFFPKLNIMGIVFLYREKNLEALKRLGITPEIREKVIRTIDVNDYVETISDMASFGDMWVIGKDYDGNELYIKIAMGRENSNTICISFHVAEYPLHYAFK